MRKATDKTWVVECPCCDCVVDLTVTADGLQIEYDEIIPWSEIDEARAALKPPELKNRRCPIVYC